MGAQRVVDGEGAIGTSHGDMNLERADQLAGRDRAVLTPGVGVALRVVELAERRAEGVESRRGEADSPVRGAEQITAPPEQGGRGRGDVGDRRGEDLQLRGRELQL